MDDLKRIISLTLNDLGRANPFIYMSKVSEIRDGMVITSCDDCSVHIGDRAQIFVAGKAVDAEVIRIVGDEVGLLLDGSSEGVGLHDKIWFFPNSALRPDISWKGRVIDPDGNPLDGKSLLYGDKIQDLRPNAPAAAQRRGLGERLHTGYLVFDTILPIVKGQRIGVFAGSGVGKSTLLGGLAQSIAADVVVIGLVGERGREVRHFVESVLGVEAIKKAVVIAATSDLSPKRRRKCAWTATAVAEYFAGLGQHVLLILDSVTRFAEAHREDNTFSGDASSARGFPASTAALIASLCERAGPGTDERGDITGIYSVLVSGSDMEEPIADMLRGVLDGHIILDRSIAEAGRYPAIDIVRSVSRSLPSAATASENIIIQDVKSIFSLIEKSEIMVRSGLYEKGLNPDLDFALSVQRELEKSLSLTAVPTISAGFSILKSGISRQKRV